MAAPFNAGTYDHHVVTLSDRNRSETRVFRFAGARQYRLQVEAFARAAQGGDVAIFTLEESVKNQKVIDAIFRAGDRDGGWEPV